MIGRPLLVLAAVVVCAGTGLPAEAQTEPPQPYRDPPFECTVIDYGTAPPELPAPPDDPLCVRYDKTNITVSDLGVVEFLAAEPGRVAIVAGKCHYWQQDRWEVRLLPGITPVVEWSGSYWYDGERGTAAGILRQLRVGGEPVDSRTFIDALRPLVGDDTADQLAAYAAPGGGGGAGFALPAGFGSDACPTTPDDSNPAPAPNAPELAAGLADPESRPGPGARAGSRSSLPDTGGGSIPTVALALVVVATAVRAVAIGSARRSMHRGHDSDTGTAIS